MCDVCSEELCDSETGRVCIDCAIAGFDPERAMCPACERFITDEGECGCIEGCAPEAHRRVSMTEGLAWGFVAVVVVLLILL